MEQHGYVKDFEIIADAGKIIINLNSSFSKDDDISPGFNQILKKFEDFTQDLDCEQVMI